MKNPSPLLLLFLFFSCANSMQQNTSTRSVPIEQSVAENKNDKINSPKSISIEQLLYEKKSTDNDPYFAGTYIDTTSIGPTSITRNVLQDSKGNIWLATWDGIIQYDGKQFINFTNKEGLRRYRVFTILEDSKQHLWFGTIGAGVYHYDGTAFTNITTKDGLVNDKVGCIYEDSKGILWFGTMGGISRYNGSSFQNFTTANGLIDNDVNSIIEDHQGQLWIGTRGEACIYDGTTFTKFFNFNGDPFVNVRCIIKDRLDHIWLGGNNGLWRFDGTNLTNFSKDFTGYMYEDRQGNIWTSSAFGSNMNNWSLSRYDFLPPSAHKNLATIIREEMNMFFGIYEDKEGGIWQGALNGVCRYDGQEFDCFKKGD